MALIKKYTVFFWVIIFSIYITAWIIQEHLFLNWDISQLLHATRLMLAGGTYSQDFFIPNPPMILLLYSPPVLWSKWFSIQVMLPFRIYIFLLNTLSFSLCHLFVRRIFAKKDSFIANTFLVTLATIFFIVPVFEFGQRDCLLLVLTMPYLLLVTSRLQNNNISTGLAISIGILAALGLAIKPQFLIIPFMVECYYIFHKRNFFAWLRLEIGVIAICFLLYAVLIFVFYADFLFVVTPFVLKNYYSSISMPFKVLFYHPMICFCWLAIAFYLILYVNNPYKILSTVLALALVGFLISYFEQHTIFLYHIIPPFSLAISLIVLLFVLLAGKSSITWREYITIILMIGLAFSFLMQCCHVIWTVLTFDPVLLYAFFTVLFALLLYMAQKHKAPLKIIFSIILILAMGFFCAFMAQRTSFYPYRFLITITSLIITFALLAPKPKKNTLTQILLAVLGMLLFSFPVYTVKNIYAVGVAYKKTVLDSLIDFMHTQPAHSSVYVFSVMGNYNAPLMDYVDINSVERFDCLWMVGDLASRDIPDHPEILNQYIRNNHDDRFFLNMIAEDLHIHKPDLIFVDIRDHNIIVNRHGGSFDLLAHFLESQKLHTEWLDYRYLTTISGGAPHAYNYKLQVYQRIKNRSVDD